MIRRLLSILTCLIMLICFVLMPAAVTPVSAASSTGKTIKVAVLNNSIYAYQDKNKVWRGMEEGGAVILASHDPEVMEQTIEL